MRKVTFDKPTKRRDGKVGAHCLVELKSGGWCGEYAIDTHGLTPEETVDRIAKVEEYHAKKAAKLTQYRPLQGVEFVSLSEVYRITDCTVREIGTDVELYLNVRYPYFEMVNGVSVEQTRCVPGFPKRIVAPTVDELPTNEQITEMVRVALAAETSVEDKHESYVQRVNALLK